MKRTAAVCVLLAGLNGCMAPNPDMASMGGRQGPSWRPNVPGVQGPWGQPVPMIAPYAARPPAGAQLAQAMMASSVPLGMVQPGAPAGVMQASAMQAAGAPSGIVPAGGITPPGVTPPGVMTPPGVPMPPGGIMPVGHAGPVPNAVAAIGAITGPHGPRFPTRRTEVRFVGPAGMKISWPGPAGDVRNNQIEAPGRYNFIQGAIYRLKLTDLPGRPEVIALYPTIEIVPANLRTDAYIAHSAVPVYFTDEDIEQVLGGNFLVKVIYLPNPQYADVAMTGGPEEVVSTRLEPGADPIAEACKRGSILLIIRMGNIDLEAPHTPPMNAPNPYGCGQVMAPGPLPGMGMPGMAMPAPGMPGGMVMQPPAVPQIPGPPMIPVTPVAAPAPEGMAPVAPAVVPTTSPGAAGPPLSKLPDASAIKPVRYQEPLNAPTPAQVAGQGR